MASLFCMSFICTCKWQVSALEGQPKKARTSRGADCIGGDWNAFAAVNYNLGEVFVEEIDGGRNLSCLRTKERTSGRSGQMFL